LKQILVYSIHFTARHEYIFRTVLTDRLGLAWTHTTSQDAWLLHQGAKINYSAIDLGGGFTVLPSGIIDAKGWTNFTPVLTSLHNMQVLFATPTPDDIGFDVFGAAFWMLTRYEEYGLTEHLDIHGRIKAEDCLMVKHAQHFTPWVDHWCRFLGTCLKKKYAEIDLVQRSFTAAITVDIDNAYAFAGKGFKRNAGGFFKDFFGFKFSHAFARLGVVIGLSKDPYDTYTYIENTIKKYEIPLYFFFLLADRAPFDKNLPHTSSRLQQLVRYLSERHTLGIHPGYHSHLNGVRTEAEIQRLAGITGRSVAHSRNHYLRLSLPESYRLLAQAGIPHDHTMGFASQPGFRAGTAIPYSMYDLELDQDTFVQAVPFAYMDGTLNEYMKLSPTEASAMVKQLIDAVRQVGGHFECIWHNETLHNKKAWSGWRMVFEETLMEIGTVMPLNFRT